jgi:hypothetical protein
MLYGGKLLEVFILETSFNESNILSNPIEKFLNGSKFIKSYCVILILSLSDLSLVTPNGHYSSYIIVGILVLVNKDISH